MMREADHEEEAAYWVNRLDQPAMDASSGPKFDLWMSTSPRNAEAFADIQTLWQSDTLEKALEEGSAALVDGPVAAPSTLRSWLPAVAAVFCIVLVGAFMLFSDLSITTYRTGHGAGEAIVLADGSHVDLSGDSELRVRILPWQRTATLARGEAFFDIKHERARTFRVHSGTTSVRVLGTAFNVDRQSDIRTEVEVYRGAVEVDAPGARHMVLRKGERTRVHGEHIAPRTHRVRKSPDWRSGWFEADDVPMAVLFAKVQRYSDRPIEFDDASLAALPITGRFQVSDPKRVLEAVSEAYGIEVHDTRERIRIRPAARR